MLEEALKPVRAWELASPRRRCRVFSSPITRTRVVWALDWHAVKGAVEAHVGANSVDSRNRSITHSAYSRYYVLSAFTTTVTVVGVSESTERARRDFVTRGARARTEPPIKGMWNSSSTAVETALTGLNPLSFTISPATLRQ